MWNLRFRCEFQIVYFTIASSFLLHRNNFELLKMPRQILLANGVLDARSGVHTFSC